MSHAKRLIVLILVLVVLLGVIDNANTKDQEQRLRTAIQKIGGRCGSIPVWPLGTEYRITLQAVPNSQQLDELSVANELRGSVSIAFDGCDISQRKAADIRSKLRKCHLFLVEGGTTKQFGPTIPPTTVPSVQPEPIDASGSTPKSVAKTPG